MKAADILSADTPAMTAIKPTETQITCGFQRTRSCGQFRRGKKSAGSHSPCGFQRTRPHPVLADTAVEDRRCPSSKGNQLIFQGE
jgi:hypothetical protein